MVVIGVNENISGWWRMYLKAQSKPNILSIMEQHGKKTAHGNDTRPFPSSRVGKCRKKYDFKLLINSRHTNPLCRVTPKGLVKEGQEFNYDKEKYREMQLESAETVL
jgi:hypothetical protein